MCASRHWKPICGHVVVMVVMMVAVTPPA